MRNTSWKFSLKFILDFSVLLVLLIGVSTYSIYTIQAITKASRGLTFQHSQTDVIDKYRNLIIALKLQTLNMLVEVGLEENLSEKSQATFAQYYLDIKKQSQDLSTMLKDAHINKIVKELNALILVYYAGLAQAVGQKISYQIAASHPKLPFSKLDQPCLQKVDQLRQMIRDEVEQASNRVETLAQRAGKIWLVIFLAVLTALTTGLFMLLSLRKFRKKITHSLTAIRNSASEISAQNGTLATRTQRQSNTLNHSTVTLDEITTTLKETADNVLEGVQLSVATSQISLEGKVGGEQTLQAMQLIIEQSDKIKQIVGLINQIAFQTNILAINAAIEAAKAGEKGKGFAVVAIEVRDLAARSSEAAKEIDVSVKTTLEKLGLGETLVQRNWQMMQDISAHTGRVNDVMGDIKEKTDNHFSAIMAFNETIQDFGSDTTKNRTLVDTLNLSSKALDKQCSNAVQMVADSL